MRAAITHTRDGCLLQTFMVEKVKVHENPNGSTTYSVVFPEELAVLEGDDVNLTYYIPR